MSKLFTWLTTLNSNQIMVFCTQSPVTIDSFAVHDFRRLRLASKPRVIGHLGSIS